jgi:hypothetical protein
MVRFPLMTCLGQLIRRQWLSHQHHSAVGAVRDQMAEAFGGIAQFIGSFDDRFRPSRGQ